MIRDITIGQYYPAESAIHKLDPRVKLFSTLIYIIALFCCHHPLIAPTWKAFIFLVDDQLDILLSFQPGYRSILRSIVYNDNLIAPCWRKFSYALNAALSYFIGIIT